MITERRVVRGIGTDADLVGQRARAERRAVVDVHREAHAVDEAVSQSGRAAALADRAVERGHRRARHPADVDDLARVAASRQAGHRAVDDAGERRTLQRADHVGRTASAVDAAWLGHRVPGMPAVVDAHDVEVRQQQRVAAGVVLDDRAERADVDEAANRTTRPDADAALDRAVVAGVRVERDVADLFAIRRVVLQEVGALDDVRPDAIDGFGNLVLRRDRRIFLGDHDADRNLVGAHPSRVFVADVDPRDTRQLHQLFFDAFLGCDDFVQCLVHEFPRMRGDRWSRPRSAGRVRCSLRTPVVEATVDDAEAISESSRWTGKTYGWPTDRQVVKGSGTRRGAGPLPGPLFPRLADQGRNAAS